MTERENIVEEVGFALKEVLSPICALEADHKSTVIHFLTALSEAGWVVVPKRPTMEMEEAGGKELPPHKGVSTNGHHASHVYRAMISAATPPAKGGE